MTPGSNANQFIGSRISLISKSEIRYEGILYALDLQEATISLAKVKSFGTEDRPTERPVPCKEEIYEFIIFRGSDIKGIDVLEPPKAAATLTGGLPNDPAIVEVSHYHSSGQANQGTLPGVPGAGGAGQFGAAGVGGFSQSVFGGSAAVLAAAAAKPPQGSGSFFDLLGRSNASTPSLYSRKSPTNDAGVQVSNEDKSRNNRQFSNRQGGDGRGSRQSSQDRRRQPRQQQVSDRQGGYQPRGRGNFVNNRGGFRGGRGGNRGGYRTQGIIQAQQPPKVTFEEAYDFEKANEELSKLKIKADDVEKKEGELDGENANHTEEEQENKEPAEPFYVKDSFYDKISCESTERGKGNNRVDWRAERKLNAETFGLPVSNGQRRGGYQRGGGFRGGFRGYHGPRGGGGYQQRGGYGYGGYGNYGYQYNNRYNGGRGGSRGGGYRQQQQQQPQQAQQQSTTQAAQ